MGTGFIIHGMEKTEFLKSGELSKYAGVNSETLRYYERKGLLDEPKRSSAGYRQYPPDAVKRIRFIKSAQSLGFSLKEILELLNLRVSGGKQKCEKVRKRTEVKIQEVEKKIEDLQSVRRSLSKLLVACATNNKTGDCPVLESMEDVSL